MTKGQAQMGKVSGNHADHKSIKFFPGTRTQRDLSPFPLPVSTNVHAFICHVLTFSFGLGVLDFILVGTEFFQCLELKCKHHIYFLIVFIYPANTQHFALLYDFID